MTVHPGHDICQNAEHVGHEQGAREVQILGGDEGQWSVFKLTDVPGCWGAVHMGRQGGMG